MDPQLSYTLLGAVITAIGWAVKEFRRSWKEAQEGRKDEADRIANERDSAKADAKYQYDRASLWRDATYATRRVAMDAGLRVEDLPRTPDDKKHY